MSNETRNPSDANLINRAYLDKILVEMRNIDAVKADISFSFLGKEYASPIMTPAFSHLHKEGADGLSQMEEYAVAAKKLNLVNFVGMEPDEMFGKVSKVCPGTIRIIKPYADHQQILKEIDYAQEQGAIAVGMDIDHVFGKDGEYDVVDGITMGPVTQEDLKGYISYTKLPFIVKGVLSVTDALKAKEAGAAAILVSHHHGRIPFGIPPVKALPRIREAVGKDMIIIVDCGIDDGYDAFKALALGADAVCVGRGILNPLLQNGTEGVISKINEMNAQLMELMEYTNAHTLEEIDPSVIYID